MFIVITVDVYVGVVVVAGVDNCCLFLTMPTFIYY